MSYTNLKTLLKGSASDGDKVPLNKRSEKGFVCIDTSATVRSPKGLITISTPTVAHNDKGQVHKRLYLSLTTITIFLSFFDFIYTLTGLVLIPGSYEINPLFGVLLLQNPYLAAGFKLVIVPACLCLMYCNRRYVLGRIGLWLCFLAYLVFDVLALYIVLTYWPHTLA